MQTLSHTNYFRAIRQAPSLAFGIALLFSSVVYGEADDDGASLKPPIHERIDELIAAGFENYDQIAAPRTDDAEFLRRVYLDLTGTLPTIDVAREFLADEAPDKRQITIDGLLDSPQYARHMQRVFDVMLMRRLPAKQVSAAEWQDYLRKAFAENRSWKQITGEILSNDGSDPKNRGPARFFLDRSGDVNVITRDIGRVFLGANLECAQCHDHPEVDDYLQRHYYGLSAFLVRSFLFTDPKLKKAVFAEKAEGEVSFESVFEVRDKSSKGPQSIGPTLFAAMTIEEPKFEKGQEYKVKPAKNVRPIPKFSRRAHLPDAIANDDNPRFARNVVNRLWAHMLGRGLVDPIDLDHTDNPPSHPELLALLASEFVAHQYDIKWLLREIAFSETYQRSSQLTNSADSTVEVPEDRFAQAIVKPLSPEVLAWSVLEATGEAAVHRAALGDKLTESELHKRLVGIENQFINRFGGQPGEPPESFESTVDQVLFLSNDGTIINLLKPKRGNLADRSLKLPTDDTQAIAEELFLSVLIRPPSGEDVADVAAYLDGLDSEHRATAVQELIWALVTSTEFRFNH